MWRFACSTLTVVLLVSNVNEAIAGTHECHGDCPAESMVEEELTSTLTSMLQLHMELQPTQLGAPQSRPARSVVVTELANTNRHRNQFRAVFHPSWRLMSEKRDLGKHTVDLMAFCEPDACSFVRNVCKEVLVRSLRHMVLENVFGRGSASRTRYRPTSMACLSIS